MRHHVCCARLLIVLEILCLAGAAACAQGPNIRMQRVLARFVEQTGHPMMGVGSWISGKGFDAATSDFDMRLVWPGGGTRAQQLADWRAARTQMIGLIRQEFGDEATSIIQRTNLYAPNQLMRGVENSADALERFMELKTAPNLAHTGPITPENFRIRPGAPILDTKQFTEGLYGSGSQTYVQAYERAAGRLFYANNGRCVTGLSELAHMGEGAPVYTSLGTANTAGQWAEHGLNELRARQPTKVVKFLERLERDLVKCRSLNGMELNDPLRGQLRSMRELLKKSPERLADISDDVAQLLRQSQAQAAMLKNYANAGPLRRAYLRVLIDGVSLKNKLGVLLGKVMAKTPDWVTAEQTMRFILVAIATKPIAESLGRGDGLFETMSNVSSVMKPLTLVGPALLTELMAEVIIQARAGGAEMAAGFQGAWDLMEGIYSAWGRAGVDPDPRMKLTLADLVANYQREDKLRERVMTHATRASTRGLGTANEEYDAKVAEAIFAQCWPTIRDAWLWERDTLASEYLQLASEVVHTPLIIYYNPPAPQPGERVVCEAVSADQRLARRIERMKQLIRILYGKGSGLGVNYYWTPAGETAGDLDRLRAFSFPQAGTYPVKVRMEVLPFTTHTQTEPRVVMRRPVEALVDIVVEGQGKSRPPAGGGGWVLVNRTVDNRIKPAGSDKTVGDLRQVLAVTGNATDTSATCTHTYTAYRPEAKTQPATPFSPAVVLPRFLKQVTARNATWTLPPAQLTPGQELTAILKLGTQGSEVVCDPPGAKGSEVSVTGAGTLTCEIILTPSDEQLKAGGQPLAAKPILRVVATTADADKVAAWRVPSADPQRHALRYQISFAPGILGDAGYAATYEYRFQP